MSVHVQCHCLRASARLCHQARRYCSLCPYQATQTLILLPAEDAVILLSTCRPSISFALTIISCRKLMHAHCTPRLLRVNSSPSRPVPSSYMSRTSRLAAALRAVGLHIKFFSKSLPADAKNALERRQRPDQSAGQGAVFAANM